MSDKNLQRITPPSVFDYNKKGKIVEFKAPKGHEEYLHEGANDFVGYWCQDLMVDSDYYNQRWGD